MTLKVWTPDLEKGWKQSMGTGVGIGPSTEPQEFETFARTTGRELRRVLVARFGVDVGVEVWADAMAWAWEHWPQVGAMDNPLGYLYRVGQSAARRHHHWKRRVVLLSETPDHPGTDVIESELLAVLGSLRPRQRAAVLLVHGYGWSYAEVAAALGISIAAVTNHVHRGLRRLRRSMEDDR